MSETFTNCFILIIAIETLTLILPEGKTNGIVKWVMSLIITLAIISPIFSKVLSNNFI